MDLELWREYDKGAAEAKERMNKQQTVRDAEMVAFTTWDTAKTARADADAAAAAAVAAEATRTARNTEIAGATTAITGLTT